MPGGGPEGSCPAPDAVPIGGGPGEVVGDVNAPLIMGQGADAAAESAEGCAVGMVTVTGPCPARLWKETPAGAEFACCAASASAVPGTFHTAASVTVSAAISPVDCPGVFWPAV